MRVALVHDYLNVYGGAERVLEALGELYPDAPIYTSFMVKGSRCEDVFGDRDVRESYAVKIPGFARYLHSPMRFLAPTIWESFNLDEFDVVISSSASYMAKGVLTKPKTLHVSYIHTPPRNLYGYDTDFVWQKYRWVKMYAAIVNKQLRMFDYLSSQRADVLVANSKEVQRRIWKFYRRESEVVYPPVLISKIKATKSKGNYFLAGGRLVGTKNFDLIVKAANMAKSPLKVYGNGPRMNDLRRMAGPGVEFLGRVSDEMMSDLYAGAIAYIAMARDEDFGITVVEAQAHGVPVICFRGGGYLETVVEGKTGEFVEELTDSALAKVMREFKPDKYKTTHLIAQAQAFSKERFLGEMKALVERKYTELAEKYA